MSLTEVCDVVAFVSEPDSTISPSEGVDGDLDRCSAIRIKTPSERTRGAPVRPGVGRETFEVVITLLAMVSLEF